MANDGKALQDLVEVIEKLHLPEGFTVTTNRFVYDDEGDQIAELDIEIRGRVGSTDFAWLIECRDRPSQGAGPISWIEQLVTRRERLGFHKVTAVSSTGFAPGAAKFAEASGIELRGLREVTADSIIEWLGVTTIDEIHRLHGIRGWKVLVYPATPRDAFDALAARLPNITANDRVLRAIDSGSAVSPLSAFKLAVQQNPELFDDVVPNGAVKQLDVTVNYPRDDSHFVIDTENGPVRIASIEFAGELALTQKEVPIIAGPDYVREGSGERISRTASVVLNTDGLTFAIEFHNLAETGQTHILLRKLKDSS